MRHARLLLALLLGCARPAAPEASSTAGPAPPSSGAAVVPTYLALGDSFTAGTGSTPAQAFPARLLARWEASGCKARLVNLGVNGYTTDDLLADELPEVRGHAPALITLAIGANDIVAGRSVADYKLRVARIFDGIAAAGITGPRVVALPQPDWSAAPAAASFGDRASLRSSIRAFNDALRDEARARGARYADLSPTMDRQAQSRMFAPDGLHPSAAAYDEWAAELAKTPVTACP